jgi:hypothetical protein
MPPNSKTHLNRAFEHLDEVIYIMGEVIKGRNAEEIRKHLVEDDPFGNDSREYRSYVAHWLVSDYVRGFTPAALGVFARIMTSDSIETQTKREILFWKNCERDELVRAITLEQVYPAYHRGEPFLLREDVVDFVVKKAGFTKYMSDKRITNYLSITSKLGMAESNGKNIDLHFFRPKRESVTAVLYFLFNSKLSPSALLRADDFKYLLLDERDLLSYLADLDTSGLIEFAMAGNVVRLEPKIAFEVLPDALA